MLAWLQLCAARLFIYIYGYMRGGGLINEQSGALFTSIKLFWSGVFFFLNNRASEEKTLNSMSAKGHFSYFSDSG